MRKKRLRKQAWPAFEPPELRGTYVGFWARAWASFLDTVLTIIVTYPFLVAVYGWSYVGSRSMVEGPLDLLISWVFPATAIVMFWIYCSATPGKMAIGAKIVDAETGGKPTQRQLVKRYVGYLVSSLPLCLGFFWAAVDPKKQGWHDKLAGTVVVYVKKVHPSPDSPERPSGRIPDSQPNLVQAPVFEDVLQEESRPCLVGSQQ